MKVLEKDVSENYIEDSSLRMNLKSKKMAALMLTDFFAQKEFDDFRDLSKNDFIEMYSALNMVEATSFITHRSKIADFATWMFEQGMGLKEQSEQILSIDYSDINADELYDECYFSDCEDLFETLSVVFENCAQDFDTFKASAILRWMGFEANEIIQIQKTNLNERDGYIINPITSKAFFVPKPNDILTFLTRYRDADSFESIKMGGKTFEYKESSYLIRNHYDAQFDTTQLSRLTSATKRYAQEYGKKFQWKSIYLSGVYFRMYQYEKEHGSIEQQPEILKSFMYSENSGTTPTLYTLSLKYKAYDKFKRHMYS